MKRPAICICAAAVFAATTLTATGGSALSNRIEEIQQGDFIAPIDFTDEDGDGLSDDEEVAEGLDPKDADTDNDGALDGDEGCSDIDICPTPLWNVDSDGDGLINALDADSDDDGLFDGTELGLPCTNPATQTEFGHCNADADAGATTTDPLNPDTDGGGVLDGAEDWDLDGNIDGAETDPTQGHAADDLDPKNVDSDGDGLSDSLEEHIGSNKNDLDSDDDGVPDGEEANASNDEDGDGKINVLDEDSDSDGLFDGTEGGYGCGPGADKSKNHCIPDSDQGQTKTSMVDPDTDNGGVVDGDEDLDKDGKYEANAGEGNPLEPSDDTFIALCAVDHPDCGPENNGKVCDLSLNMCVSGCKDSAGSGCPEEQVCIFPNPADLIGYCSNNPGVGGSGVGGSGVGGLGVGGSGGAIHDDGCSCSVPSGGGRSDFGWVIAASAALAAWLRRRAG